MQQQIITDSKQLSLQVKRVVHYQRHHNLWQTQVVLDSGGMTSKSGDGSKTFGLITEANIKSI